MTVIEWLEEWYKKECNGDWEHSYGVKIETLDNPGWVIFINLEDTSLENLTLSKKTFDNGNEDWYTYSIKEYQFRAFGDPSKLEVLLKIFKEMAEKNT